MVGGKGMRLSWRHRVALAMVAVAAAAPVVTTAAVAAPPAPPDLAKALAAHASVRASLGLTAATSTGEPDPSEPGLDDSLAALIADTVAVGDTHTCALGVFRDVWCFGANDTGQLGVGTTAVTPEPVRVSAAGELKRKAAFVLDAGRAHTCALASGDVDTADPAVYCWGDNNEGQLGDGTSTARSRPVPVLPQALQIAAGQEHTCAVLPTRTVSCWGRNDVGQLGIGSTGAGEDSPQPVPGLTDVVDLSADDNNTCALDDDGAAWCWGSDTHGQIGDGGGASGTAQSSPVAVVMTGIPGGFTQLDVGRRHVCAVAVSGAVHCWGADAAGQLGNGAATADVAQPAKVTAGDREFFSVDAGGDSTCAVSSTGQAFCWGANADGQLGVGGRAQRTTPAAVDQSAVQSSPITKLLLDYDTPMLADVVVGRAHSCAVDVQVTLYCWGGNAEGQLGDGGTADTDVPALTRLAPGQPTGVRVAAGDETLAVSWRAPASTGVAPIEEYAAFASTGTGLDAMDSLRECSSRATPACELDELTNGSRYGVFVGVATLAGAAYSTSVFGTPQAPGAGGGLPVTGTHVVAFLAAGAVLSTVGAVLTLLGRRRTRRTA